MKLLEPRDFELVVDLVFSTSGWRRQRTVGKTQKTVDLDEHAPSRLSPRTIQPAGQRLDARALGKPSLAEA